MALENRVIHIVRVMPLSAATDPPIALADKNGLDQAAALIDDQRQCE